MRHSASVIAAATFVALTGAASAGSSESVQLAPVNYAFIAQTNLGNHLVDEQGAAFDRDYVRRQLNYQHANDALCRWEIQNGSNPALIAYARETLPKIDDHMHRVEALLVAETGAPGSR
jgi:hypothetical protein